MHERFKRTHKDKEMKTLIRELRLYHLFLNKSLENFCLFQYQYLTLGTQLRCYDQLEKRTMASTQDVSVAATSSISTLELI